MSVVEGVVGRISEKPFNGKKFYSFALNGQEGWYGTGMKRPPTEGTSVRFESKKNGRGYLEVDGSIEVRTDGEVDSTPSVAKLASKQVASNSGGASGAYWDRKESRDIHNDELREIGATRNTAISIIDLMIKHEAIKLPAAGKREEFLWSVLDRYVTKLRGKEDKPVEEAKSERLVSTAVKEAEEDPQAGSDDWN